FCCCRLGPPRNCIPHAALSCDEHRVLKSRYLEIPEECFPDAEGLLEGVHLVLLFYGCRFKHRGRPQFALRIISSPNNASHFLYRRGWAELFADSVWHSVGYFYDYCSFT